MTVVGYGRTRVDETKGPTNIEPNGLVGGQDVRNVGTMQLRSLQQHWLTASGNPATGDSGTCHGDSGGPYFLGDSDVVAETVLIDDPCRSLNRGYRRAGVMG